MGIKNLIVVVGPTAVGKTDLCITLAEKFNTGIISADSRQFYREMSIGTAKPTEEQLKKIPHYFINSRSVTEDYTVGKYEAEANELIMQLFEKNNVLLATGGSGLFVKALTDGLDDVPEVSENVRNELNNRLIADGLELLVEELKQKDPEFYKIVDKKNPRRVIRALEVIAVTGKPYSVYRKGFEKEKAYNVIKIGLTVPREKLYERINQRVDKMMESGLLEEVQNLNNYKKYSALQTVGYTELFEFFEGKFDLNEAVRLIKRNTRRYAKRQMTWFSRDNEVKWFNPEKIQEILDYLSEQVNRKNLTKN